MAAYLALLLFSPWFAILAWAYWKYPKRQVEGGHTRAFDLAVLASSLLLSAIAMRWTFAMDWHYAGNLWPQVIATLAGYHAFLAVLAFGWFARGLMRRRRERAVAVQHNPGASS
jgi:hypothetical protein